MENRSRRWMTTSEVAQLLEMSESTVRRWARQKKLPHFLSPGGHYRFDEDEVRRFVEARRVRVSEVMRQFEAT